MGHGRGLTERIAGALSEPVMGFLALVATFAAVTPLVFEVSAAVDRALEGVGWFVVALFAVEWVVDLRLAPDRRAHVLSPWRLLDLATVVVPLVSLLPGVSGALRASPVLRLVRFVRVLVLGARLGAGVARGVGPLPGPLPPLALRASVREALGAPAPLAWPALVERAAAEGGWFHAAGVGPAEAAELARRLGLPPHALPRALADATGPRAVLGTGASVIALPFVRRAVGDGDGGPEPVEDREHVRHVAAVLVTPRGLVTLSSSGLDLHAAPMDEVRASRPDDPSAATALLDLFARALDEDEELADALEARVRELEQEGGRSGRAELLQRTFRLQQLLAGRRADLRRLRGLLEAVAAGRLPVAGGDAARERARALAEAATWAHDGVTAAREALLALIDLHLNVASFEVNRVMKVLAVLSALGLVPAMVGGVLGMNLVDAPWSLTLPQVAYALLAGMTLFLYVVTAKGWLR